MNEQQVDIKEKHIPKGIVQKFIDAENKIEEDNRKEQMKVALDSERSIIQAVKEKGNKEEKDVQGIEPVINSAILAEEIKKQVDIER